MAVRSLDATVDIETPEQVVFSYTLAGAGSRAIAALADYLICLVLLIAVVFLAGAVAGGTRRVLPGASVAWAIAVVVVAQFAIVWGYYVLFEGLNDGQTPGKRWFGLRVVQDGGFSVSLAASAVRNLARVIDILPPFFYAVGLVSIAISRSGKRIGDMLAGTIVVRERVTQFQPDVPARAAVPSGEAPKVVLQTSLTDDEFSLLSRFMERRKDLDGARAVQLGTQLAARFRPRAPDPGARDTVLLASLFEHEKAARSRGVAARSDTGAAREQHALVAAGSARWAAFAARIAEVQRTGLSHMPEDKVGAFVAEYRELSTDLARLQTASRGREVDAVFYLSRLVAAAHNLVYRQRRLTMRAAVEFMSVTVPLEIRNSAKPILLSALLLFGPTAIAYTAVSRHPAVAAEILPPSMLERATLGVERAKNDEGYIPDPELMRPVMASRIVANNVQVTFFAFAFGVTAGIGTLFLLVFNGVSVGSVLGLYQSTGILPLILAFVAPHSVLELGAISVAGGGGLLIASAILLPGALTRREAFVVNGRRAIRLIAASTLFLVLAGTIEGFISPIPWWPLLWKAGVTVVTAIFFFGYMLLGYRFRSSAPVTAPRAP
jgi:uncharacterized membrane protein SpoIIM required for sporulation/uncharacterized RDD family membrane protein YckC